MDNKLSSMLKRKQAERVGQTNMAMKEVVQETILAALSQTDFFSKASFYGGSALRIFYGLARFSEDLDFSLASPDPSFSWEPYFQSIITTFAKYGLKVETVVKEKISATDTRSAFLKENAIETWKILLPEAEFSAPENQSIKIKFEIDINPPAGATSEWQLLSEPFFSNIKVLDEESLFAGKVSAVLLRGWKNRLKGRDFYDYLFYVGRGTKINLAFLQSNLEKAKKWDPNKELSIGDVIFLLQKRFEEVDFIATKEEVAPFLFDPSEIRLWSKEFFSATLSRIQGTRKDA